MHQKQIEIKRRIRAEHINEIKATMRGNMIDSIQRMEREAQFCRSIDECIVKEDMDVLFYLFTSTNSEIIQYLNDELIWKCYRFLKNQMDNLKAVILIQSLIEEYFSKIFENYDLKEQNQQFVEILYRLTNSIVDKLKNSYIDYNGALSLGLNYYLKILKNFYRREFSQNGSKNKYMLQINKTIYIEQYIIPWIRCLLNNKTYLFIIVKITAHRQLLEFYSKSLLIFQTDLKLTHTLIDNIYSGQDQCSIQSFKIIVNIINSVDLSQNFVQNMTHDFLLIVIRNFKQFQKKLNGNTHSVLFMGFRALNKLLFVAQRKYVTLNTNCYIFKPQFYQILMSLLLIETQSNRQELYGILQKSLQILEANNLNTFKYINRRHFDQILEDVSNNCNVKTLSIVIRILLKIIRSNNINKDFCNELINYLIDKNIICVLQILQFHQNRQIGLYAKELLENEFRQQQFQYTDESNLWKIQSQFWKGNK